MQPDMLEHSEPLGSTSDLVYSESGPKNRSGKLEYQKGERTSKLIC